MAAAERRRIAFLSAVDAANVRSVSGTPYHMARALERHCGRVTFLGPLPTAPVVAAGRALNGLGQLVTGRGLDWLHSRPVSRSYGRRLGRRLRRGEFDVVFAPFASTELAFLETDLPVVYSTDATFALVHDYLPAFSKLWARSAAAAHEVERRAIQRADALVYPTEWAARSAMRDYGASRDRVSVHPFGANLVEPPPAELARRRAPGSPCRLLFLGVDWVGKGGAIALAALEVLRRAHEAELVVCGPRVHPAPGADHVRFVRFLDKNRTEDRSRLDALFKEAHFLVLPTRAECYGLVLCEAAAYGLPALATATGGVPDVIRDGVNGLLLPWEAGGSEYAERVLELLRDEGRYRAMAGRARGLYEDRLNWDAWGRGVQTVLEELGT